MDPINQTNPKLAQFAIVIHARPTRQIEATDRIMLLRLTTVWSPELEISHFMCVFYCFIERLEKRVNDISKKHSLGLRRSRCVAVLLTLIVYLRMLDAQW